MNKDIKKNQKLEVEVICLFGKKGMITVVSGKPAEAVRQIKDNLDSGLSVMDDLARKYRISVGRPEGHSLADVKRLDEVEATVFKLAVEETANKVNELYRPSEVIREEMESKSDDIEYCYHYYGEDSLDYRWAIEEYEELKYEFRVAKAVESEHIEH